MYNGWRTFLSKVISMRYLQIILLILITAICSKAQNTESENKIEDGNKIRNGINTFYEKSGDYTFASINIPIQNNKNLKVDKLEIDINYIYKGKEPSIPEVVRILFSFKARKQKPEYFEDLTIW